jgi:hypothetical protein
MIKLTQPPPMQPPLILLAPHPAKSIRIKLRISRLLHDHLNSLSKTLKASDYKRRPGNN